MDLIHLPMLKHVNVSRPRHPGNYGIRHCYPVWKKLIIVDKPHWGEAMIFDIVETLERVHAERGAGGAAEDKALAAVELMRHLSWDNQVKQLFELMDRLY